MDTFEAEDDFLYRKVKLTPVTEKILSVPNYRIEARSLSSLILDFNSSGDHATQWKLEVESERVLRLRFGLTKLDELRTALAGMPKGDGDYAIRPEESNSEPDQDLVAFR